MTSRKGHEVTVSKGDIFYTVSYERESDGQYAQWRAVVSDEARAWELADIYAEHAVQMFNLDEVEVVAV